MTLKFEITGLVHYHPRGQFIFARMLDFKEPLEIKEDVLMNDFYVYQYLNMYPWGKHEGKPEYDRYVFKPTSMKGFPKDALDVGQIVSVYIRD